MVFVCVQATRTMRSVEIVPDGVSVLMFLNSCYFIIFFG